MTPIRVRVSILSQAQVTLFGGSDKGKGKAVVPSKRSKEGGAERQDAAKKQRHEQDTHQERDEKDKAAQEKVCEWRTFEEQSAKCREMWAAAMRVRYHSAL